MNSHLNSLQETIFSIREKLSDNEYLSMMNDLKALFQKYQEREERDEEFIIPEIRRVEEFILPDLFERCPCSNERWNFNYPCYKSLDGFLRCDYLRDFLEQFPLTHFVLSEKELVFPKLRLHERPILNFEKKLGPYDKNQTIAITSIFINALVPEISGKKYKIWLTFDLFSFLFSNYKFVEDNPRLKEKFLDKIANFREEFEPSDLFPENLFLRYNIED